MHHLILLRESGQPQFSGCCAMVGPSLGGADACSEPARETGQKMGALYRSLRTTFGEELEITILDPRNVLPFLILVLRDAWRYRVPPLELLRTLSAPSLATGILDGRLLFRDRIPTPDQLDEMIEERLGKTTTPSASGSPPSGAARS